MRQIGQAMVLYANENRGAYPPSADELLLTQDITTEVFICASSDDQKANQNAGTATMIADFHKPGHNSYVYVGNGLTTSASADAILLYEPLTDHSGDGCNFLFSDGHVEFESKGYAQAMINELQAGHNPPRPTVMRGVR
jgi:prepilin-type processing-associated H-X9-DG protein